VRHSVWCGINHGPGRVVNRQSKLLQGIDLSRAEGLEFGPLSRPILRRPAARVAYVDHVGTVALRQKYRADPKVAVSDIVDVDVVWSTGALRGAIEQAFPGTRRWFDYVIASHVIEHVPDVIWWLAEIRSVMSSGAALRLIIPDRRFTMDIARRETGMADMLSAYLAQARRPQAREILDFYCQFQRVDAARAWAGQHVSYSQYPIGQAATALELAQSAIDGAYHDVHCSVFTPRSFLMLMHDLARLGMIWFSFAKIHATARNELDFFVHLQAADDPVLIEQSWRDAVAGFQEPADAAVLALHPLRGFVRNALNAARRRSPADR
jgi:hypothetical protein